MAQIGQEVEIHAATPTGKAKGRVVDIIDGRIFILDEFGEMQNCNQGEIINPQQNNCTNEQ